MSKHVSAKHITIKAGETAEIDSEERVVSAEYRAPYFYLIVVKESNKNPKFNYETNSYGQS